MTGLSRGSDDSPLIEDLDVADVGMGVTGVTSLIKAISSMATLWRIDIRGAAIDETGLRYCRERHTRCL
eukprot:COSAG01_NODE_510_length_16076_cov_102.088252_4_plen_69_part_00